MYVRDTLQCARNGALVPNYHGFAQGAIICGIILVLNPCIMIPCVWALVPNYHGLAQGAIICGIILVLNSCIVGHVFSC